MVTKRVLSVFLLICLLSITSCSTILKTERMQFDNSSEGWMPVEKKGYVFQVEGVSFVVRDIWLTDSQFSGSRCLWIGPPLLPIFPNFGHWSNQPRQIALRVEIESTAGSTALDLYRLQIELGQGNVVQPTAVYTEEKDGTRYDLHTDKAYWMLKGKLVERGKTLISQEKLIYNLQFDQFPLDVDSIIVNFGRVQVNEKEIVLPLLKYRKSTKYQYYWINDV